MTAVVLFDATIPGDDALENSHWMAERTRERLGDDAVMATYPHATRAELEARLAAPGLRGLALFGHGDPGRLHTLLRAQHAEDVPAALADASRAGAVYGSDGQPALDADNLHRLRGLWTHALACNVGLSLAHRAVDEGISCFVAYETSLTPEYETKSLPAPLSTHLAAVVTATTVNLHAGLREATALKARVQEAVEALETWLDGDEGTIWSRDEDGFMHVAGLLGLAHQLVRDMIVRVAEH